MSKLDLSLYLVLDPDLCGGIAGMVDTARVAAAHGATVVQLRAPNWKKKQWLACARELRQALAGSGVPLIINDQVDIALAVDADGVHVGQDDLPVEEARRLIGPGKWLGLSVTNSAQMEVANQAPIDYVGIGPAYPTSTKLDAAAVLGGEAFARLCAASRRPVVGIGGIGLANCAPIIGLGAGIAVVSAICGQPDPAAATARLREAINSVRNRTSG